MQSGLSLWLSQQAQPRRYRAEHACRPHDVNSGCDCQFAVRYMELGHRRFEKHRTSCSASRLGVDWEAPSQRHKSPSDQVRTQLPPIDQTRLQMTGRKSTRRLGEQLRNHPKENVLASPGTTDAHTPPPPSIECIHIGFMRVGPKSRSNK